MSCLKYKPNHHITGIKIKHCILRWSTFWSPKQAELDTLPNLTLLFTWQPGPAEKKKEIMLNRDFNNVVFQLFWPDWLPLSALRVTVRVLPLRRSQLAADWLQKNLSFTNPRTKKLEIVLLGSIIMQNQFQTIEPSLPIYTNIQRTRQF